VPPLLVKRDSYFIEDAEQQTPGVNEFEGYVIVDNIEVRFVFQLSHLTFRWRRLNTTPL